MDLTFAVSAGALAAVIAGLYLFRRRSAAAPAPRPRISTDRDLIEEDIARQIEAGRASIRNHHYVFAHVALRQLFFDKPEGFLGVLSSPRAPQLLKDLWLEVGKRVSDAGEGAILPPDGLFATVGALGPRPCAVVTLPKPEGITEAFMVAAVVNASIEGEGEDAKLVPIGDPPAFYYTLEKGMSDPGKTRTVLCSWNAEDSHANYGDGPAPEPRAFLGAVEKLISGKA